MAKVNRNGVHLNFSVEGSGPTVVAISGLMSTLASSQFRLVPGLPEAFRMIYGEHRGAGESDAPKAPYTVAEIVDDWIAIMDAAGAGCVPVLGNSFGSMIAQHMALTYPDRVSRLVLSVPVAYADSRMSQLVSHWYRTLANLGEREFALQAMLWTLTPGAFVNHSSALMDSLNGDLPRIDAEGFRGQLEALKSFDVRDQLHRIQVPTLIVAGRQDQVCPLAQAEELGRLIPNAELVVLDNSGHLPQTEQGAEYAGALLPFLAADCAGDKSEGVIDGRT